MNAKKNQAAERRTLTKEYDFRTLRNLEEFTPNYIWPRKQVINKERAFYVDPDKVDVEQNPFTLSEVGLSIRAMITPPDLADYAMGIAGVNLLDYNDELNAEERKNAFPLPLISGVLTTRDSGHSQLFGFWEGSMKLPSARGAWPAFWLLPTHEKWPEGVAKLPEIDIMEAVKDVVDGVYHGSLHTNESGVMVSSEGNDVATNANLTGEYNRYGLSWEPDWIIWYFNGVEVIRRPTPADMQEVSAHILINLAVGGWGGEPVLEDYAADSDIATFDIEWIRVYQNAKTGTEQPVDTKPEDKSLRGDVVGQLDDGRLVTRADINLVTEWMRQSSRDTELMNLEKASR